MPVQSTPIEYACYLACDSARALEAFADPAQLSVWLGAGIEGAGAEQVWRFPGGQSARMRLKRRAQDGVHYLCEEANVGGCAEWAGTQIEFNLASNPAGGTDLAFAHRGWRDRSIIYAQWTHAWDLLLNESLAGYLETGTGAPFYPHA